MNFNFVSDMRGEEFEPEEIPDLGHADREYFMIICKCCNEVRKN
jgi:hypothetical protein